MRRARYSQETVATIGDYQIVRFRSGAGSWWQAQRFAEDGYLIKRSDDLPTRRDAEAFARYHAGTQHSVAEKF